MLALVRPEEWNLPLFLHVLGALSLVGALFCAAMFLFGGRAGGELASARAGYKALLVGALPSYLVMRIGAQWVADKEGLADSEAAWIGIGYITAESGMLLIIGATIAAGLAVRRAEKQQAAGVSGRGISAAAWITAFLVVLYLIAIVVMVVKPT